MQTDPRKGPFRNPPEVLARRDAYAKAVVESFERNGQWLNASIFKSAALIARDMVIDTRPLDARS